MAKTYYMQSGIVGNCILFWRKGSAGYTCDVTEAEEFTEERAISQIAQRPGEDIAWPVEHIREVMQLHVHVERADHALRLKVDRPKPVKRSCNRHSDCDAAPKWPARGSECCHDDECEDCFGS